MEDLALECDDLKSIINHSKCRMDEIGPDIRGVVYAVEGPMFTPYESLIKIGHARSVMHRLPQIEADIGGAVFLHGVVWTNQPAYLEIRLHDLWAEQKAFVPYGREWFTLTEQQLEWFKSLGTINTCVIQIRIENTGLLLEWRPSSEWSQQ